MAWTAPVDHAATVVTVVEWNNYLGTTGNLAYLKAIADAPMKAQKDGGAVVGGRKAINFVSGLGMTITVADDAVNDQIDVTLAASGNSTPTQMQSSVTGAAYYTTITADGAADTYGAWTTIVAATSFAVTEMIMAIGNPSSVANFHISISLTDSHTPLITDLSAGLGTSSNVGEQIYRFRIAIPAATKVLAQVASDIGGSAIRAAFSFYG
jgi:hypothetical protein